MLIDLHAKTHFSEDVTVTPRQLLQRARDAGLDGIAVCDTLSTARSRDILELAETDFEDLNVFVGVEIPTDRGVLVGFAPRIDEFYFNEEWGWLAHRTTPAAEAVLELFDEVNGVTIAARPYDQDIEHKMGDYIFQLDRLGAVEVYSPRVGRTQNNFALEAAAFMEVGTTGGSDPHGDASSIGRYATFFEEDVPSQRLLVDALRESEYWAVEVGAPSGG